MIRIRFFFFILALYAFQPFALYSQEYDSTYITSNGVKGKATFEYYYDLDHLRVKNGPFKFKSDTTDSVPTSIVKELQIEGEYSENKKVREWLYQLTSREIDILEIKDSELIYDLKTYRTLIRGNYDRGTPSGNWSIQTTLINNKSENKTVETTEITLRRGYAEGTFTHQSIDKNDNLIKVTGQFEEGFFDGQWRFNYTKDSLAVEEIRSYSKGILTYSLINEDTISFPLSPKTRASLNGSERGNMVKAPISIEFEDGYPQTSLFMRTQQTGNRFMRTIQNKLMQFDQDILQQQSVIFGSNRAIYPLTEEEEALISAWNEAESEFQNEVTNCKGA